MRFTGAHFTKREGLFFWLSFAELEGIWGCEDREMEKEAYLSPFLGHPCLSVVYKPAKFTYIPFMSTIFSSWPCSKCQPATPRQADGVDSANSGKKSVGEETNTQPNIFCHHLLVFWSSIRSVTNSENKFYRSDCSRWFVTLDRVPAPEPGFPKHDRASLVLSYSRATCEEEIWWARAWGWMYFTYLGLSGLISLLLEIFLLPENS